MSSKNARKIFITGTDTNVGKTLVSAWLCQHWPAHYWKPIQTGHASEDVTASLDPRLRGDDGGMRGDDSETRRNDAVYRHSHESGNPGVAVVALDPRLRGDDSIYRRSRESGNPANTDELSDRGRVALLNRQQPGFRSAAASYCFPLARSPHEAAAAVGKKISLAPIVETFSALNDSANWVIEGAGGLYVPINDDLIMADLIATLDLPCLIVARSGLGTINHTCLSLALARQRGLRVLGVIMVGPYDQANREAIERYGHTKVLADIPWLSKIDAASLANLPMPAALRSALNAMPNNHHVTLGTTILDQDQRHCWHPFTQAGTAPAPQAILAGEGAYLIDHHGQRIFDGIASWWVNTLGHAHAGIANAIAQQARRLEHTLFAGFTHAPAAELAEQLIDCTRLPDLPHLPDNGQTRFERVFYSDNGSTAIEIAMKMAVQYFHNLGKPRQGFLALQGGYHGDTFGAMSVGRTSGFYQAFAPWLFKVHFMPVAAAHGMPIDHDAPLTAQEIDCLKQLDNILTEHGESLNALLIEPLVQGAAGMVMMRRPFVEAIVMRCRQAGMLIIFDEVMTGFYRTGSLFASHQLSAEAQADFLCLSKGLTGGFLPLAVTLTTGAIYQAFVGPSIDQAFLHGHTYTANPLACSAALANLQQLHAPSFASNHIQPLTYALQQGLAWLDGALQDSPSRDQQESWLSAARCMGGIAAFEYLQGNLPNKQAPSSSADAIRQAALARGLLVRPLGKTLYLLPPYCSTPSDIRKAFEIIREVLMAAGIQQATKPGNSKDQQELF